VKCFRFMRSTFLAHRRVGSAVLLCSLAVIAAGALRHGRPAVARANDYELAVSGCGVERWDIKTLGDPAGLQLHPRATGTSRTISALVNLPVVTGANGARGIGTERREFTLRNVILKEAKAESDSDIHLVVANPASPATTMIVEFPLSSCMPTQGPQHTPAQNRQIAKDRVLVAAARNAFVAACGTPGSSHFAHLPSGSRGTISGIGFFDVPHGQTGVAPNAIELHPAVKFQGHC
jgi:hypothetical protein